MEINTKDLPRLAPTLTAGDKVELTGTVYTSRDAAHKRLKQLIEANEPLPFELVGATIYYAGPTGTKPGMAIGSCGPTTSGRMDPYAPMLMDLGLTAMIGKGERAPAVVDAIKRNKGVYFCAIGGAGALACQCIKKCEVIAFEELGCESVKKLEFDKFPLIVTIDCKGNDLFKSGRAQWENNTLSQTN